MSFIDRVLNNVDSPAVIRSQPINREAIFADRRRVQEAVFFYLCYVPEMKATRDEIAAAFGFDRHKVWNCLQRLVSLKLVRLCDETRNRSMVYTVNTVEN